MRRKKKLLKGIIVGASIMAGIMVVLFYLIQEYLPNDPRSVYYRQYKINKQLRQEVREFTAPENLEAFFYQHEEELQSFADKCYEDRESGERKIIDLYYIEDEPYYFSAWENNNYDNYNRTQHTAIKEGEYSYITEFMDYSIKNKIVFRDWMSLIITPYPVDREEKKEKSNQNMGPCLFIRIYDGVYNGTYDDIYNMIELSVDLVYSPYAEVDYSEVYEEDLEHRNRTIKVVRITPNWYYYYQAMN